MPSCLLAVESREFSSLVSAIDPIEFADIMWEFLSDRYLRHCKENF